MDKEYKPASNDALAEEARLWDSGALSPAGWLDAPDAIPRNADSATVSIRLSKRTLAVLDAFARREGVGCGALVSRRVDERAIAELTNLGNAAAPRAE